MKIDFVIPWVDGNDIEWQKDKNKYLPKNVYIDANINRYRDWGLLKYWFRGVEKFAPWVNKVFFITYGHIPDWLNLDNEKLVIVNHKDYIPTQYLPTFSSNPIELNLHRIKDLSDHFVYFNDDLFLTDYCYSEDFFKNGLPCDFAVEDPITFAERDVINSIIVNDLIATNSRFNRKEVLNNNRKKFYSLIDKKGFVKNILMSFFVRPEFTGLEFLHMPQPFLKSTFEKVWEENHEWLDETCNNKFRSSDDLNQYLFKFYQYCLGEFTPYNVRKRGYAFQLVDNKTAMDNIDEAVMAIINQKYKMICLNDTHVTDFETTKNRFVQAFDKVLPTKCSFEKR